MELPGSVIVITWDCLLGYMLLWLENSVDSFVILFDIKRMLFEKDNE